MVRCVRQNSERQADAVKMVKEEDSTARKGNRETEIDETVFAMFPVTQCVNDMCKKWL